MTKKLLSSMLAVAMLSAVGSVCAITASAEEYDITGGEITFRINNGWKYEDAKYYIHIWDGREGGETLYEWQSKKELMTISEDGETATYNVPEGNWNLLILTDGKDGYTYDTVFNQKCMGDTFTTKLDTRFAPVDTPQKGPYIVWDNNPDCGQHRMVSESTNFQVEGHAYIPGETDQTIFEDFCEKYGPREDGTSEWDEVFEEDFDMTWEEVKGYVASKLDLTEAPTEKPTEESTEAPTQQETQAPTEKATQQATQAPTQKPTQATTTATNSTTTGKGTVNTADNSFIAMLSAIMLSAMGVATLSFKKRAKK